jgi:hypothetical protein
MPDEKGARMYVPSTGETHVYRGLDDIFRTYTKRGFREVTPAMLLELSNVRFCLENGIIEFSGRPDAERPEP